MVIFWAAGPNGLVVQDCLWPVTQTLAPDPAWIDEKTKEYEKQTQYPSDGPDGVFSSYLGGLAANLLMLMSARPELVEKAGRTGKVLKSGAVVHSPSYIGRKYAVIKQQHKGAATGAHFTELGWRSGHYKQQHYGPKNQHTKIILVDPYIAFSRALSKGEEPCPTSSKT